MTPENIVEKLKQLEGVFEVYHVVSTFKLYRRTEDGESQEVTVEILDAGPTVSERYFCRATSNDGRTATGNPQTSIEYAMMHTHWNDLDKAV